MKRLLAVVVVGIMAVIAVFGIMPLKAWYDENEKEDAVYIELAGIKNKAKLVSDAPQPDQPIDWTEMLSINPNFIGWLTIEDTPIDYPVVSCMTNKYLYRAFDGSKSSSGCLFTLQADWKTDQNIVIYGHNMGKRKDVMFSSLLKYKDKEYFAAHPFLSFDDIEQNSRYKIIAAFNTKEQGDIFFQQTNFTDEEWGAYISACCKRGGQDVPEISPDMKLITLVTCDRSYGSLGRFCLLAAQTERTEQWQKN